MRNRHSLPARRTSSTVSGGSRVSGDAPRYRYRLNRLGVHFLFVGGFAMLGGALRGFNLLLILAGGLTAALLVQWRWSKASVERLTIRRRLPAEAFAGKPFRVRFRLVNHARLLPSWLLRVDDELAPADGGGPATIATTPVAVVPPGGSRTPAYDCLVRRRGRYRLGPATVASSFPLCLMTAQLWDDRRVELDVFPRILELRRGWQKRLLTRTEGAVTSARRSGPVEGEFFGLREWRSGDHPRLIHWRTTARIGEPAVRQFERQRRFDVCLLLDAYAPPAAAGRADDDASPDGPAAADTGVETAISLTATLLIHLVAMPSNRVVLTVADSAAAAVTGGGSLEGKRRMLSLLARVRPADRPPLEAALRVTADLARQPRDLIVISSREKRLAVTPRSELSRLLQPWTRTGTLRWIDAGEPAVVRGFVKTDGETYVTPA